MRGPEMTARRGRDNCRALRKEDEQMNRSGTVFSVRSLNKRDRDRDSMTLSTIEQWILERVGGGTCLERDLPMIARQAIEQVIDWPRTGRQSIDDVERAERAYLSTRLEIMFRYWLGGVGGNALDVDGIEVGVKNVFGRECWISNQRIGRPLLIIQTDLGNSRVSLAALVARSNRARLTARCASSNNAAVHSRCSIHWLCVGCAIKKSAIFTQMMLMHRRRAEQERLQLRAIMVSAFDKIANGKN